MTAVAEERPSLKDAESLKKAFSGEIVETVDFRDEISVSVKLAALKNVLTHAKEELGYDFLIDITTVDHSGEEPRFEVVYELTDIKDTKHLRIKARLTEDEDVPSAVSLWKTANWHEREAWDMMGIKFADHPDLRRILMWEGYPYFPLRKEFPLAGKPSEMPDVAFTGVAPLEGGPFVTSSGADNRVAGEPRAKGES